MGIRFSKIELRQVELPMRVSFKHALAERKVARNLVVCLHTTCGQVGWGEALPRDYLTGETLESAWDDILNRWWPYIKEMELPADKDAREDVFAALCHIHKKADALRKTSSYGAVDIAVFDAWAKCSGVSGMTMLGENNIEKVRLTAPLGGGSKKSVYRNAWLFKLLGFRDFKLKVAVGSLEEDLTRIRAVRSVIGNMPLRVDANAGYGVDEAINASREFLKLGIGSFEQPVPPGSPEELAEIQRQGVPVMADESICTITDAWTLAAEHSASLWNLRPAKVGGFSGMRKLCAIAHDEHIHMHLGVLVGETSLMAAAGRACLALGGYEHVEYGFARILLKGDPFRGGPAGYFGKGKILTDAPGLGLSPVTELLEKVTTRKEER